LRWLLRLVFLLFGLLAINSLYLLAVTVAEQVSGESYQDYLYLILFLVHLLLGLALLLPVLLFGPLHLRNAWHRPNRYAVRAGLSLYTTALLLLVSGILLTRFDFLEINDPQLRQVIYWVHVITPVVVIWLFVLHRLAGSRMRWRMGAWWSVAAVGFTALMLTLHVAGSRPPEIVEGAYSPAQVKVQGPPEIPPEHLTNDEVCGECHRDIAEQAAMSMHRFSSFNNPAYRFSVEEARQVLLERDGDVHVARLCAACHDQVPLFSGRFDNPDYDLGSDPDGRAGITCVGCHAITAVDTPLGNGAYTITDPPRYPFAFSDTPFLKAVNRQLIKAKPSFHKKTFLKPIHKQALFCSSCHKVHLPYELNHYRWLRGQNHYDSFRMSGVSGHRVDSFYYPKQAVANCAHCHMPLSGSDDPAARDFNGTGQRSVHSHLFPAANTAVPLMLDRNPSGNDSRRGMMQNAARVDIFGLREGGRISGQLQAPLRPALPLLEPGRRYLLETVVRTLNIGHQLTQGTTDSNELWLEVTVRDGERMIGRSGDRNGTGEVDPWSYFLNSYLLDREGRRIERRNAQDIFVPLYDHQIPPGAATVVHYGLELPPETQGPVTVEVKLQYRKFDSRFLRHVLGDDFAHNDLPITTLAVDRLELPVKGGGAVTGNQSTVAEWERWNDYGIGLLRQGNRGSSKGELRQAVEAFTRVEQWHPGQGALNLARVYFKEGRLKETAAALRRAAAADPPAPPWALAWFSARVDGEYGNLDQAITTLEELAATRYNQARARGFDFSRDTRVLNALGRLFYQKARRERGAARQEQRLVLLRQAREWLLRALKTDPENAEAHYTLALVESGLGDRPAAERHRGLHDRYRRDDQAVEQAVSRHRRDNPAANHAAQAIAVYDLQRPRSLSENRNRSEGNPF
jgi:tetratricopeptide (TPR) repeat protein